jgi:hypothetical protein
MRASASSARDYSRWFGAYTFFRRRQRLGEESIEQAAACIVTACETRREPVAERHQLTNLGDDAALLRCGRQRQRARSQLGHIYRSKIGGLFRSFFEV